MSRLPRGTVAEATGYSEGRGDTILTTITSIADTTDEETVDTTGMDFQDIEGIRERDPFLYHSIVQHQRRCNSRLPRDHVESNTNLRFDQFEDTSAVDPVTDLSSYASRIREFLLEDLEDEDIASNLNCGDDSAGLPEPGNQHRRRSRSLFPARIPSSNPGQRRFSQSFSEFTTGVVTRQHRVTTECHHSLVIADPEMLASLLSSSFTSSTTIDTLTDGYNDCDLTEQDLDDLFG